MCSFFVVFGFLGLGWLGVLSFIACVNFMYVGRPAVMVSAILAARHRTYVLAVTSLFVSFVFLCTINFFFFFFFFFFSCCSYCFLQCQSSPSFDIIQPWRSRSSSSSLSLDGGPPDMALTSVFHNLLGTWSIAVDPGEGRDSPPTQEYEADVQ